MAFVSSNKLMSFSPEVLQKISHFFFSISDFNQENTEVHVGSTILRVF